MEIVPILARPIVPVVRLEHPTSPLGEAAEYKLANPISFRKERGLSIFVKNGGFLLLGGFHVADPK